MTWNRENSGDRRVRSALAALAVTLALGGCSWFKSDDAAAAPPAATASSGTPEEILKKNCSDETWKQQNLGLWYSVCRQPMRW
jgi:hypothetical protein